MAGTTGLEPATSAVTGQRSNQLSYVPEIAFNNLGFEPSVSKLSLFFARFYHFAALDRAFMEDHHHRTDKIKFIR